MNLLKLQQSIREEFEKKFGHGEMTEIITGSRTEVKSFLSTAIEKVAREVFKEIVSEEEIGSPNTSQFSKGKTIGRNSAIAKSKEKFKKFMGQI